MEVTFAGITYPVRFWRGEDLEGTLLCVDTETVNIEGPWHTPELVLLQVMDVTSGVVWLADWTDGQGLVDQFQGKELIMHNSPFDVDVLRDAFEWSCVEHVENDFLWDTGIMFRLRDLALRGSVGRWALDYIAKILLNVDLSKSDEVRMGWTRERRCHEWNDERLVYGALDVVATAACYHAMEWIRSEKNALSHQIQLKGEIALNRVTKRGLGFDLSQKEKFLIEVDEHINSALRHLADLGYMPGMKGIQAFEQNLLLELEQETSVQLPRSPKTRRLSTKREDLEQFSDISPFVKNLLDFKEFKKLRDFVGGLTTDRVHPRYDGIKNTGRTSCSNPNIQQLPRRPGVRECFVPSPGCVFVIVDYSMLELVTLAQTTYSLYGFSQMRELLNQSKDLHRWFASKIFGVSEEEVTKDQRQAAKAANFGYPGGLGPKKFIAYSKNYGCNYNLAQSAELKDKWTQSFPEMDIWLRDTIPEQFDWGNCPIPEDFQVGVVTRVLRGEFTSNSGNPYSHEWIKWVWANIIQAQAPYLEEYNPEKHFNLVWSETTETITGRQRARASYNASRNTRFQGLGADVGKTALWMLDKKGYKTQAFIHDEVIVEVPEDEAEEALKDIERVMLEAEAIVCPDVRGGVEGSIKKRWTK